MNLTQEKFAKKADINLRHLQDVESGASYSIIYVLGNMSLASGWAVTLTFT